MFENLFTPPAKAKQGFEANEAQIDLKTAFVNMLANAMLESDMPEYKKIGIRVTMKAKAISDQISEIMDNYADPDKDGKDENKEKTNCPVRQEVYDFLSHIENEIKEFINSHPLPADTRD